MNKGAAVLAWLIAKNGMSPHRRRRSAQCILVPTPGEAVQGNCRIGGEQLVASGDLYLPSLHDSSHALAGRFANVGGVPQGYAPA